MINCKSFTEIQIFLKNIHTVKITFYGAARKVTGSKHMITTEHGENILLDCGLFQGEGPEGDQLNRHFGFEPSAVDYVILSHAHIDHTGLLPKLVRDGFSGPIYANSSTIDLCRLMLADSAHIQEMDLERINRRRAEKKKELLEPLYTIDDVKAVMQLMVPVRNESEFTVGKDTKVLLTANAHILGSVAINLTLFKKEKPVRITFTGDIGRPDDKILSGPDAFPQADYIICESTYGERLHPTADDGAAKMLELVKHTCLENHGKIIIPAFSVDRTQEIIYMLDRLIGEGHLPPIPTFVDSPLSVEATHIMNRHREEFNHDIVQYMHKDGDPFGFPGLQYITKVEDSKKINDFKGGCIIISASGMAEAGRVKHHIANNIEDSRNTILLVGYATPMSLAGKLKDGETTVRIFGEEHNVLAQIESMPYFSAHADWKEMLNFLSCQIKDRVKEVFLVHGSDSSLGVWKGHLLDAGYKKVTIAEPKMVIDI
jgi:metallo-beta-lactamase family protein